MRWHNFIVIFHYINELLAVCHIKMQVCAILSLYLFVYCHICDDLNAFISMCQRKKAHTHTQLAQSHIYYCCNKRPHSHRNWVQHFLSLKMRIASNSVFHHSFFPLHSISYHSIKQATTNENIVIFLLISNWHIVNCNLAVN